MSSIRPAAVADMFYPGNPEQLRNEIAGFIAAAPRSSSKPKALIVPHAGYIYSGSIAASAYATLDNLKDQIKKVVLLGPCHRIPLRGLAVPSVDYFETPLGKIPIDKQSINLITKLPQVKVFDLTHQQEHSLEVQLPFLQEELDQFLLTPIVVGDASPDEVYDVLEELWGGSETLIVISSDLSHFHDYETAKAIDASTCEAIENFNYKSIDYKQACGRNPIIGLLMAAQRHQLKVTTLDLKNSGDTAGSKDRVVGYGSWIFEEI